MVLLYKGVSIFVFVLSLAVGTYWFAPFFLTTAKLDRHLDRESRQIAMQKEVAERDLNSDRCWSGGSRCNKRW